MTHNPFVAPYDQLPKTLPIFPLAGTIVMPGNDLPLNIFEPRYLNMISDALGSHHMIGMIQPNPDITDENALYHTGCAGRITQYRETNDGRIELVLSGVCRYDLGEELPTTRGYRMTIPNWSRFTEDYVNQDNLLRDQKDRLTRTLKRYFEVNGLEVNWNILERLSTVKLVNSLTMSLPISKQDKQTLLERVDPADRLYTFVSLLGSPFKAPEPVTRG